MDQGSGARLAIVPAQLPAAIGVVPGISDLASPTDSIASGNLPADQSSRAGLPTPVVEDSVAVPHGPIAATSTLLLKLSSYIENTWLKDRLWTPERWSVYGQAIRTNNDAEGWHNRLNGKVFDNNLNLYRLIDLLYDESRLIPMQVELLSQNKLTRVQREVDKTIQQKLFAEWDKYEDRNTDVYELLDSLSTLYSDTLHEISQIRRLAEYYVDDECDEVPDAYNDSDHSVDDEDDF